MTKHIGTWGGIFLQGTDHQIGTIKGWSLEEKILPVSEDPQKVKRNKVIGWTGIAKKYILTESPPEQLEFRLCQKFNWFKCYGTITSSPAVGEVSKNKLIMEGDVSPKQNWRKK